jgi:hypothetical protein
MARAFISYRRQDDYVLGTPANPDFAFLHTLKTALSLNGFEEVFVDTDPRTGIDVGDDFEARIYQAIVDCDLFLAVIGKKWTKILEQKTRSRDRDSVVYEIRAAIREEKEFVPLLIDGAQMPHLNKLVKDIKKLYFQNGLGLDSGSSANVIAAKLRDPLSKIVRARTLTSRWTWAYVAVGVVAYYLCAINPHIFGVWEFRRDTWLNLALVWSGLFVWPVFFLPFVLLALYRPLSTLVEGVMNAIRWQDRITYTTPIIAATVLSVLALLMEVSPPQVPWTVHPYGPPPQCSGAQFISQAGADSAYEDNLRLVTSYDSGGALAAHYPNAFWLRDRCWPNAFFYLTIPASAGALDNAYKAERPGIARAFDALLNGAQVPYSWLFPSYVISFTILIWLTALGILMSIFYITVSIRRAHDGRVRSIPSEDAYLCLTYAFLALLLWLPFRINTIHIKVLYSCEIYPCAGEIGPYIKDIVFAVALVIAFAYLTAGLLVRYHRIALSILGGAAIALFWSGAVAVYLFPDAVARLAEQWQTFIGIAILLILVLLGLWYQFDPAIVRFNDFRNDQMKQDIGE